MQGDLWGTERRGVRGGKDGFRWGPEAGGLTYFFALPCSSGNLQGV